MGRGDGFDQRTQARSMTCFNGAAPFGARRCRSAISHPPSPSVASTGPRLLGRGDPFLRWRQQAGPARFNGAAPFGARRWDMTDPATAVVRRLQRGRAFWGAEILNRQPDKGRQVVLQRGRAFWGAEIRTTVQWDADAPPRFNGAAPFGARRLASGFPVGGSFFGFNGAAPFGARRFCTRKQSGGDVTQLQRGRAFWGAEISMRANCPTNRNRLQRGRAFWGAEIDLDGVTPEDL